MLQIRGRLPWWKADEIKGSWEKRSKNSRAVILVKQDNPNIWTKVEPYRDKDGVTINRFLQLD